MTLRRFVLKALHFIIMQTQPGELSPPQLASTTNENTSKSICIAYDLIPLCYGDNVDQLGQLIFSDSNHVPPSILLPYKLKEKFTR